MNIRNVLMAVSLMALSAIHAETITCKGDGPSHLQGVACDGSAIYWCFTTKLVKTDLAGTQIAAVDVVGHSGDLCVHNGKVYIATEEGRFVRSSNFKQEVRVYDAATLQKIKTYNLDEDCAARGLMVSAIEYANERFWLAMGQAESSVDTKNYVMEYTPSFEYVATHELATGNTQYGLQTIAYHDGKFYIGTYSGANVPASAFICDSAFQGFVLSTIPAAEGVMSVTGVLYTAVSSKGSNERWTAVATSVDGLDRLYSVNGTSGDLVDTPEQLLALGFLPKSRYYGGADATISGSGTEQNNLIANAVPRGGNVFTLDHGTEAYAGGITVPSGTLTVPSAEAINAPAAANGILTQKTAPIVLSEGTLRFAGGGTLTRDIALFPLAGNNRSGAIIDVSGGAVVTNTGTITSIDGHGNLFKTGAGTFVLATPGGDGVVTNFVGSHGENPGNWKATINIGANGDGPTTGNPSFGVFNGRFVIATGPKVVTDLGVDTYIGGPTTQDGVETAGHLDIYSGIVRCTGFFTLGRDNGNATTAPDGLSSTMNLYGGSFYCDTFDMSYTSVDSEQKNRPVLNIHGGTFDVANIFRMDYLNNYGTINVDGGTLTMNEFYGSYYAAGGHVEINVSDGGKFVSKTTFAPVRMSSAEHPSYARVNVTNGGVFEMKTMANSTCVNPDARYFFDGGILKSRQSTASDEITAYMPVDVGANGMTVDVTGGLYWGLKIRSSIQAKSGVTDGGLRVVSTAVDTDNHWLNLLGGVTLDGGVAISNAYVCIGCNVNAAVTLEESALTNACIRPTADVTISSIAYSGKSGRYDVAMSGVAGDENVRAYVVTANSFTPPTGLIAVHPWKQDTTTGSYPTGSFPFLRVPASSSLDATRFAYFNQTDPSWWFEDSVADGWRTISIVHGTASSRPAIDPRTSDDWLTGSGNNWTLGPWILPVSGDKATANYMLGGGGKGYNKAGALSVSDSLTLSGGGLVASGPFIKLGDGTLTLSGDKAYTFASSLGGNNPKSDKSNWNQFDSSGNATTNGYPVPLIVGAGTLVIGTGYDNPTISSGKYPLWIGCPTTTTAGSETDAAMEVKSGLVQVGSDFFVGRNRPASTAAHSPLVSSYLQSGGEVDANKLFVGYSDAGEIYTLQQTFNFTLNGGRFSTRGEARVGTYWGSSGSIGNTATMTINGGLLEIGASDSDGYLRIGHSVQANCTTSFEMNGGQVVLWRGLLCPSAGGDANHHTQLRLNGGTLTFGGAAKPIFTGNAKADLYWNGTVLKPYRTDYLESCSTFDNFAVREIGAGGAIIDLSDANIDNWDINTDFTGSGNIIVRGGNTNRALRIYYNNLSNTGDWIAEKGGVIQQWGNGSVGYGANKTVRVKDGGGVSSYYSYSYKNIYLGETAADSTFVYGYGYSSYCPIVASSLLQIKGTVYCALRTSGVGNPIRVLKDTLPILRGPKGSFADVDVATQFKVHPLLDKPGLTVTFALDTSNSGYDQVTMTSSDVSYYLPGKLVQSSAGNETSLGGTMTITGTVTPWVASTSLGTATSGGGTIKVTEPLSGNGTIKLTTGRIEGRPEDFDGVTLDLNNASVRFTESGHSTVNLKNSDGGATGLGLEVAKGKTVYVSGLLTNRSALVKMDLGTLVLQNDAAFTLAGNEQKGADNTSWTTVPTNGDVPSAQSLTVNAGTLVFDMPGKAVVANGTKARVWVGGHPIPDGNGGACPAVLEVWQGELHQTNEILCIGRYVDNSFDNCSKFNKRPYAAVNLRGGTIRSEGLAMGYSNYKYTQGGLYELNIHDGLFEVGKLRVAIPHDATNVKCGNEECESVLNIYGGTFRKLAGDSFAIGGYYETCVSGKTYPARGTINVYGGLLETDASVTINLPHQPNSVATVNLYGGLVVTKNFFRKSASANTRSYVNFDGGTFRPLENNGTLSGFTAVTVGAGGGMIDMTNSNTYTVSQLARASDLNGAADGGFGASGTGTLVMNVANGYNGPTRVSGTATLKQGVANALSDVVVLDGGTLDLNGIAATFRSIKGHGTIIGNCTVTEFLELDGALTVNGNLTLDNGVAMRMEIDDDGTALTPLTVTGALTGGSGISIDFGRYHDRAFRELQTQIGSAGSGAPFAAQAKHVASWNTVAGVNFLDGAIMLNVQPRGVVILFR